ncbi:MAG TPA: hypothetical protein VFE21_00560 [Rubrobacteraceae bacterium]|nr:hypothetical protein [Rubrobacteraceae bacterium]
MRGFLVWVFGTVVAFLVTAGAFLLLANLGSNASERSLESRPSSSSASLPLELKMGKEQLESFEARPDQAFYLVVSNQGESAFSKVNLTLRVSSEDTALSRSRYYRAEIEQLKAGGSKTAQFSLDLSPFSEPRNQSTYQAGSEGRNRTILEVQATTPEGISVVKTAVLPLAEDSST